MGLKSSVTLNSKMGVTCIIGSSVLQSPIMSLDRNTIPQVLYSIPDPHSAPSELYVINGTILDTATDPVKCWVVKEEHGFWDEATRKFWNRAKTFHPNDPNDCLSITDVLVEVEKQVMRRVREGFKYQLEWDPMAAPQWYRKYEIAPDGTRKEYE